MTWQFNPYSIPLFMAGILLLGFALHVSRRRSGLSVTFFLLFILDIAALCLTYGMQLLSAQPTAILWWAKVQVAFGFMTPMLWVLFVVAYTRHAHWITPWRAALLVVIPVITIIAALTNELHFLTWAATGVREVNGLVYFDYLHGPLYWVGVAYTYTILLGAAGLLIGHLRRSPGMLRGQIANLLISMLIPWVAHIVTLRGWEPIRGLDLLPYGLALMGAMIAWSLFRYRLLDLVPTAYDAVVKSMSDAVIVLDARDQVIDANPAAQRLLARSSRELVGSLAQHALNETWSGILPLLDAWETTGEISRMVNGERETFDVRISPLRDLDSAYSGRVLVLRDATQQRRSEEVIRQYARELEDRNRDLDTFTDTVAHDLRAPLHLITGYAGLMLDFEGDRLPDDVKSYLTEIQRAGFRMNEMVQNLLTLARLRETPSEPSRVDAGAVARSAAERFKDRILSGGVTIDIEDDLPPAFCYAGWMEEVFANLIGNAITYIGSDNPAPRIAVRGRVDHGIARYEVEDNGLGISPEVQEKLFEMFTRFHPGAGSGFGMGLSIVHRIVTRMNGQVGVVSSPGKGSTFWFTLPAAPLGPTPSGEPADDQPRS